MRRPWPSGVSDKSKRHAEELKPQIGRKMVPAKEFDIHVCKELWLEQLQLRSCGGATRRPFIVLVNQDEIPKTSTYSGIIALCKEHHRTSEIYYISIDIGLF